MNNESLNRTGVRKAEILATISEIATTLAAHHESFDLMSLGDAIVDELVVIAGKVPDQSFATLVGVAAVVLSDGAQAQLADMKAQAVVAAARAKKGGAPS